MLRFCDSFDHYSTAQLSRKWTGANGSITISAGNGRNGTHSLRATNASDGVTLLLDDISTWIVGFSIKLSALPTTSWRLVQFFDGATLQCFIVIGNDGSLAAYKGDDTLLGASAGGVITAGVAEKYVEFKVGISDTIGVINILVDEVSVLSLTTQDTQMSGNATADTIKVLLDPIGGAVTVNIDDLYICDTAGAVNDDFLGNVTVQATLPNAAGTSAQWTPVGAPSNYQAVDEAPSDDDVTHVRTVLENALDLHNLTDPTLGTDPVHGIFTHIMARKEGVDEQLINRVIRSGGTNYDGAEVSLGDAYAYYSEVQELNPAGGAWTLASVGAAEFGYRHVTAPPFPLPDYIWFKADNVDGLDNASLSDTDPVDFWHDSSGNSRHATTGGSPTADPEFMASGINSLPVVVFDKDESDKLLFTWSEVNLLEFTFYAVFEVTAASNQGTIVQTPAAISGINGTEFGIRENFGEYKIHAFTKDGGAALASENGPNVAPLPHGPTEYTWTHEINVYQNGTLVVTTSGSGPGLSSERGLAPDGHVSMKLAEVMGYFGLHDAPTQLLIETYLRTKWGTP